MYLYTKYSFCEFCNSTASHICTRKCIIRVYLWPLITIPWYLLHMYVCICQNYRIILSRFNSYGIVDFESLLIDINPPSWSNFPLFPIRKICRKLYVKYFFFFLITYFTFYLYFFYSRVRILALFSFKVQKMQNI